MATLLEEIRDTVKAIDGKVNQLLIWKAEHTKAHELIERDVAETRDILFENPGLVSKVDRLWNCKSSITERRKFWLEVLKYLIVAGIVAIVTWLLLLYKKGI